MKHLNASELEHLRNALLREQRESADLLSDSGEFGTTDSQRDATGELSVNDNHPGDLGSEQFEREKDLALQDQTSRRVAEAQDALKRMEDGTYGICETCGAEIPFERLEAVPATRFCREHSPETSVSRRRPVEEKALHDIGPTGTDDRSGTMFDGEDAWQTMERWGTSNTPALSEEPEINDYNGMYIESGEADGYVEPIEQFLATDLYGKERTVIRNRAYRRYMKDGEGDTRLEP